MAGDGPAGGAGRVSQGAGRAAGAFIDRASLITLQQKFESLTEQKRDEDPILPDLPAFCLQVLGWEASDIAGAPGGPELPDSLAVSLPEYGEVLSPTYAVPDPDRTGEWLMLIKTDGDTGLDSARAAAPPMARLAATALRSVCSGRLVFRSVCSVTPAELRLVYAPASRVLRASLFSA